jgi:membrane associated rhomboid family serine protease
MNSSQRPGWLRNIPPVTLNLIIINLIIGLVELAIPTFGDKLIDIFGLHYFGGSMFNPIQIVTNMFLHSNTSLMHVLFNMFSLYMFGRMLEMVWGPKRFLLFYFVCGIGASIMQELVWHLSYMQDFVYRLAELNNMPTSQMQALVSKAMADSDPELLSSLTMYKNSMVCIGASGAVFGILLGFAFVFPNLPLYIMFIPVPIKAKYMVIGYAVIEFFLGVTPSLSGTIAHFAHLGGMFFGILLILYWQKKGTLGRRYF